VNAWSWFLNKSVVSIVNYHTVQRVKHNMNYLYPYSVLLGYIIALVLKPKNKTNLKLLLALVVVLLSLTVMHLLPDVYESKTRL
jgi:hypothetical protein